MSKRELNPLTAMDGETLAELYLPQTRFCVSTLLPQGVTILGGAPKIGKSWLVLDLCDRIAKGEPLWGLPTYPGTTLYLCLEDTLRRVQERLNLITDSPAERAFYSVEARSLADGLIDQLREFITVHPDTVLIAIDTLQMVRGNERDNTYATDYAVIRQFKTLADELRVSLLLVHHLRKMEDSDPLNKLSGTTGLSGAADATLVLEKEQRSGRRARLICTGQDVEDRVLNLEFGKDHRWELLSDSLEQPETLLPEELRALALYLKETGSFSGGNTELADRLEKLCGHPIPPKSLKQQMNRWRYALEERGIYFRSRRSNGQRLVEIQFQPSGEGDASDVLSSPDNLNGTCVPAAEEKLDEAGRRPQFTQEAVRKTP